MIDTWFKNDIEKILTNHQIIVFVDEQEDVQNVHPAVILGKIGDDLKIYLKTSISKELN